MRASCQFPCRYKHRITTQAIFQKRKRPAFPRIIAEFASLMCECDKRDTLLQYSFLLEFLYFYESILPFKYVLSASMLPASCSNIYFTTISTRSSRSLRIPLNSFINIHKVFCHHYLPFYFLFYTVEVSLPMVFSETNTYRVKTENRYLRSYIDLREDTFPDC